MKNFHLKDYNCRDTIVAQATAASVAALAVIRVSGRKAVSVVDKIFRAKRKKRLAQQASYSVHYGWIVDGKNVVDEVLVTLMRAPYSYTREDVVEISSHGGVLSWRLF